MQIDAGKAAEYVVASELLLRNLVPLWPSSAHMKYDIVVLVRNNKALRLQVKGTYLTSHSIRVQISSRPYRSKHTAYSSKDVDVIVIHAFAFGCTYVIPIQKLRGAVSITIKPYDSSCPWKKYIDNWKMFGSYSGIRRKKNEIM
jgi:hypothetical protein